MSVYLETKFFISNLIDRFRAAFSCRYLGKSRDSSLNRTLVFPRHDEVSGQHDHKFVFSTQVLRNKRTCRSEFLFRDMYD